MHYQINDRVAYNGCEHFGYITNVKELLVTVQYDDFSDAYRYHPADKFLSKVSDSAITNHYKNNQKVFWVHDEIVYSAGVVRYIDHTYIRVQWDDYFQHLTRHYKQDPRLVKMCRTEYE